ncbi:hypothetical protein KGQ90_16340 [Modicisalibacter tunisiensis]|uniref:hypothetical protein n=1 Tax=Modicisalibacter tunisiensis TaxID=390637 RepID=UPI001CCBA6C9|nr:hypothetical protein [Modicisalibacter tunisiensis]MBZ9540489.1 hypothetical protein [Modicisalibacter tunisiensis]
MTNWTEEERRELGEVRRKTDAMRQHSPAITLQNAALNVWFLTWCRAVKGVADLPLPSDVSPLLHTVLADFKAMGPRLVMLCEEVELSPGDFRELLEEAHALEAKARQARCVMPEGEPESPEALALLRLALASQGLPYQLRHYADTRREVTQ